MAFYLSFNVFQEIVIVEEDNKIVRIDLNSNHLDGLIREDTRLLLEAKKQLIEYFNGSRKHFSLPLKIKGTSFMEKVWGYLQTIPYGKVVTYKDVALAIKHPKAYRAVGMACNRNAIPIIIPCHRVIGSNNQLIGYASGLDIKAKLLKLEQEHLK